MRILVEKQEDNKFKVIDLVEMETLTSEKVEVIKGTTTVEKDKVLEVIKANEQEIEAREKLLGKENIELQVNSYKENIEGDIEILKDHNKRLDEILDGINKLK